MSTNALSDLDSYAYDIRRWSLRMVHKANSSHIGGALSAADILAVLYGDVLSVRPDEPAWPERDRFILSKGHCCSSLYAALALKGFFDVDELDNYGQTGSMLMCHASHHVPGVEWSTGSLGHGLGLGCGQALAAKRKGKAWRVFVVMSDGEMDEGSNWEAILFAAHHGLDKVTVIIDENGQQAMGETANIMKLGKLSAKFDAFGWQVCDVDGHDTAALQKALHEQRKEGTPSCIVAHTVKGKGVKYMENDIAWHYRAPKTEELLAQALDELDDAYGK